MKRVYIDIEVSPTKGYSYQKYEGQILSVEERSIMLSFAWKWEGEKKINCVTIADFPGWRKDPHNDINVVKKAWEVLEETDLGIAHNGDNFDIKELNKFFIFHKLNPPSLFKTIDTLKAARRYFRFFGNSLDDLATFLGIGKKIETEKGLWKECLNGSESAYRKMKAYNKHDVYLLVEVYKRLLPWIQNHPHIDPEMGHTACPACGGTKLHRRGFVRVITGFKVKLQCQNCGHWHVGPLQKDK